MIQFYFQSGKVNKMPAKVFNIGPPRVVEQVVQGDDDPDKDESHEYTSANAADSDDEADEGYAYQGDAFETIE